ncbi:serine/threonine-protein kinase [Kribbella speibonae]|uniref:non-specific serine/threonine protein kinase n=1 Tax=Kribbella speibonae TaxID=1572660 RepID=A0A4R0J5B5_9ACTN|nr:serine/threonine-protein kinase [Kribbella speibonae]TCC40947.1 serine/threonine protein kinase [Kribbella speibonae]
MGVPTRLGRYVVRRRLGSGGFATVWLAHDEQLDAEVAIKVLADNWGHDDSVRQRFLEEGRFLRRVESEHVVQVHDVGELEDGRPFLVLTYADRGTLADRLKKAPLALPDAVDVVVQVGRGLQALHRRGLLHRDVKPANVLFRSTDDDGERAVLSDLGLGKSLDEISRITMPGGTPSYVAPEQALGERLDQRADQYSLGAVAYAALTGRSPHQVDGLGAASRVKVAPPPSSLGFELPGQVDAAIVRALDPDREKRWPDVQTFTRQLVGALDETTRDFPLSTRETVIVASEDLDAKTALSDENQPTIVKPAEPSETTPADAETVAVESAAAEADAEESAGAEAETAAVATTAPRKRRRGRWVVAALLALLVGGGAGYGGHWYLSGRKMIQVSEGQFSVTLPEAWAQSMAQSDWTAPGGTGSAPAFRVSRDPDWSGKTPGVFIGVSKSKLAVPDGKQCGNEGTVQPHMVREFPVTDRLSADCFGADIVLLQRVVDHGDGGSLLVQVVVPGSDVLRATEIADSVTYTS